MNSVLGEGMMVKLSRLILPNDRKWYKKYGFRHGIAYPVHKDDTNGDLYILSQTGEKIIMVDGTSNDLLEPCEWFIIVNSKNNIVLTRGVLTVH